MANKQDRRSVNILGFESSCDDTGVAIVNDEGKILSNCVHSQLEQHLAHGGIIPVIAKEYHLNNIDRVAQEAVKKSGIRSVGDEIDAISVATRPGLHFSLQVGLNYARTLAKKYAKPLIPIHHMQAHALMPLLENPSIKFPFLALLISGGHCLLAIAKRYNDFYILGHSLDDAPGDLLDKVGRRCRLKNLGPPYDRISGGASIELLSKRLGANRFRYLHNELSIPMLNQRDCDFSFSGYRGALDLIFPSIDDLWRKGDREKLLIELSDISASLQRAILLQIAKKLQRAYLYYRMRWRYENEDAFDGGTDNQHLGFDLQNMTDGQIDLVISGGVAANSYLLNSIRTLCKEEFDQEMRVYAPSKALCSDNGLMIAWNGALRHRHFLASCGRSMSSIKNLENKIIYDISEMDSINAQPDAPIGVDIRHLVRTSNISTGKFTNAEFKLVKTK